MAKWTQIVLYHPALPVVMTAVSALLISVPVWALASPRRLRSRIQTTMAKVIEKEQIAFGGVHHCWVEFAGRRCRIRVKHETWSAARPGQEIPVRFDPAQPDELIHGRLRGSRRAVLFYRGMIAAGLVVGAWAWKLWSLTPSTGLSLSRIAQSLGTALRPIFGN